MVRLRLVSLIIALVSRDRRHHETYGAAGANIHGLDRNQPLSDVRTCRSGYRGLSRRSASSFNLSGLSRSSQLCREVGVLASIALTAFIPARREHGMLTPL